MVAILCSPIIPYVILARLSRDKNSPAWALTIYPMFVLFASLPIAAVISFVAAIRRSVPIWIVLMMWVIIGLSVWILFVVVPVSPWV
jgi:hypothetical protein